MRVTRLPPGLQLRGARWAAAAGGSQGLSAFCRHHQAFGPFLAPQENEALRGRIASQTVNREDVLRMNQEK